MRVSIRSDICLALRLIATQEHYRKTQDWLAMLPELQQRTSIIVQSQSIIETQAAEMLRLRAENAKMRDMLLRSDKLTRQEWYDMRNTQLAEEANAAALKETNDD